MKTFAIYSKPNSEKVAIKVGISWPAFFFGGFWAFYKRMWGMMFAYIAIALSSGIIDMVVEETPDNEVVGLICYLALIAVSVWMSLRANEWVEDKLERKGYSYEGKVEASNRSRAIQIPATQEREEVATRNVRARA